MADLRMGVVDLARASGLSEKHIRTLLNDGADTVPRDQTRWALCDALGWTPDSIDRILEGLEPVDVTSDNSGDVSPLAELAGRLAEIEALQSTGLETLRAQQEEMVKFFRLHQRLEGAVGKTEADLRERIAKLEKAVQELRRSQRRGDADSP